MNMELLRDEIKRDEGLRLKPYRDTLGHWTIGYGHLLGRIVPERMRDGISKAFAETLLADDLLIAVDMAHSMCGHKGIEWRELSDARQRAFCNMAFNLGGRLATFHKMWERVEIEDWDGVAWEMLDSKWARQVGDRAERLAKMMREG